MIPIVYQSYRSQTPNRGYWDNAMLDDIITRHAWNPVGGHYLVQLQDISELESLRTRAVPEINGCVMVLPARHHADQQYAHRINEDFSKMDWGILILIGDEESAFPSRLIRHPNIVIYKMMARPDDPFCDRKLLNGYTPHTRILDGLPCPEKDYPAFFAGQITHERRAACTKAMENFPCRVVGTEGFTLGLPPDEYMREMARAKVVPCPSGPRAPDSFRFAEALEAGCIPIADAHAPIPYPDGYWQEVFGTDDLPFPVIDQWNQLPDIMTTLLADWRNVANRCSSFWMTHKRDLAYALQTDISGLSGIEPMPTLLDHQCTAVIFTSPSPWHPSTEHIDRVIKSIRHYFPIMEIIILCDGVRPELQHRADQYQEYLRRLFWKCHRDPAYGNIIPIIYPQHMHQAAMMRALLSDPRWVKTPLILPCEHDTPIVIPGEYVSWQAITVNTTRPIPWEGIFKTILSGDANVVRLYHRADGIPDVHQWLMRDKTEISGVPYLKTLAWSQRPHVADTCYYRRILRDHFSADANTFIEDRMMTFIQNQSWEANRVMIYWPSDEEAMRTWHSDSRCGPDGQWDPKLEELLVF